MKKLKNGWVQGSAQEFLELSDADMAYIETKRALAGCLREQRVKRHLTQTELAARLETSQSRVAKMESGDSTVSIDLLLQALYRIGTKRRQLAALL
jgi:ribosome-binding protein aMBF1 (putative translation factor)